MIRLSAILLLMLSALLFPTGQAAAAPGTVANGHARGSVSAPESQWQRPMARDRMSLDQAAAMVRRQTGGRIIKASSRTSNGRTIHSIRVLTRDGKVFTVRVDAASGRVL